jgi:hypothetical protein
MKAHQAMLALLWVAQRLNAAIRELSMNRGFSR